MKSHKLIYLLGLMCILILATSCTKSSYLMVTPSSEITQMQPTINSSAISTRNIDHTTPTSMPMPTHTLTPGPTFTLTPSRTLTVISTLAVEDARLRLLDLLDNNGDCRLPCLWGITPGESMYQDAKEILMPLSSISDFTAFSDGVGNIMPNYPEGDLNIYINIDFLTNDDIVSGIAFEGRALKERKEDQGSDSIFDSHIFGERLNLYMLPHILAVYGHPSSVLLSTLAELPDQRYGQGHFKVLLLYPDQGILVHYTTEMSIVGENVVGCLANAHVKIALGPSGDSESFYELLAPTNWPNLINNYLPLEHVTSMTIDDFYQTFRQPVDICLETPANLWPVPER